MTTNLHISKAIETKKPVFQKEVIRWAAKHMREFPWRKNRTPYRILVAEVLLRRTTASAVLRIYEAFLNSYPTIGDLANADEKKLETFLSTIGYQKQRAKILKDIAMFIIKKYHGKIPRSSKDLLSIPHVGPYIAGAIQSFGYGISAAMVDSNVDRIMKRVFSNHLPNRLPDRIPSHIVQDLAGVLVPKRGHKDYNFGLLDLGALVCRYDSQRCQVCPLKSICDYQKAGL